MTRQRAVDAASSAASQSRCGVAEQRPAPVPHADHDPVAAVQRPVAPDQAGVEHGQVDQVAPAEAAVDRGRPRPASAPASTPGRPAPPPPAAPTTARPGGRRGRRPRPATSRPRTRGRPTPPPSGGGRGGPAGGDRPCTGRGGPGSGPATRPAGRGWWRRTTGAGVPVVLVDVVADVHHEVDVAAGQVAVGVEPSGRQRRARDEAEAQVGHGLVERRCGPGAPHRRRVAVGAGRFEPVPVGGGRVEVADVDLHREVVVGTGRRPCPWRRRRSNPASSATCHPTSTDREAGAGRPAGGVHRVHSSTPSGSGSPLATPWRNELSSAGLVRVAGSLWSGSRRFSESVVCSATPAVSGSLAPVRRRPARWPVAAGP